MMSGAARTLTTKVIWLVIAAYLVGSLPIVILAVTVYLNMQGSCP